MLVDDYIKYYDTYKEKFGDRAVVLIQVGSFFGNDKFILLLTIIYMRIWACN